MKPSKSLSYLLIILTVATCSGINLPNLEDVFGPLWKSKAESVKKKVNRSSRVKRQNVVIGDESQDPFVIASSR